MQPVIRMAIFVSSDSSMCANLIIAVPYLACRPDMLVSTDTDNVVDAHEAVNSYAATLMSLLAGKEFGNSDISMIVAVIGEMPLPVPPSVVVQTMM